MSTSTGRTGLRSMAVCILLLFVSALPATAGDWGPWEVPGSQAAANHHAEPDPLDRAVRTFQKYISPVDGARCPMYPTCSAYSRQALRKHGPLLGIFLTVDRLLHESDPIEHNKPIVKWGTRRFYDPLSANDFWLSPAD